MATMNFSIPDDVKAAFNEAFKDRNKREIITRFMRRAIEDHEREKHARSFVERMREIRLRASRTYTDEEVRKLLDEGRP